LSLSASGVWDAVALRRKARTRSDISSLFD